MQAGVLMEAEEAGQAVVLAVGIDQDDVPRPVLGHDGGEVEGGEGLAFTGAGAGDEEEGVAEATLRGGVAVRERVAGDAADGDAELLRDAGADGPADHQARGFEEGERQVGGGWVRQGRELPGGFGGGGGGGEGGWGGRG